ncbi:hypothetical protein BOX15_Mlig010169g1, partial [Macrostomum lignano]
RTSRHPGRSPIIRGIPSTQNYFKLSEPTEAPKEMLSTLNSAKDNSPSNNIKGAAKAAAAAAASNQQQQLRSNQWAKSAGLRGRLSLDPGLLDFRPGTDGRVLDTVRLLRGRLAARHGDFLLAAAAAAGSAKEAEAMIKEATALEELPAETTAVAASAEVSAPTSGRGKKIGDGDGEEKRAEKGPGFEPDWSRFEGAFSKEMLPAEQGYEGTVSFITEVVDLLLEYLHRINDRSNKVLDFHHPHQLREALSHCLEIPVEPRDLEQILSDCKETLKYAVKTGHPRFFNQLSSGLDVIAMAGEWLTAATNTNMFTYEIAPVFVLMEEVTLQKMREHIGWESGDGILAPGGSISNLYAAMVARYNRFPEVKMRGMRAVPELAMFTSKDAHYSVKKSAAILGMGMDSVYLVDTDNRGKMLPEHLEQLIGLARSRGQEPFFVSATGGTTVLGAFDPLDAIADVCERHGLWFHVDTAWGGGVLLSQRHRHLLAGVQRADSVTWNPHKLMGVTLQCSVILLPERHIGLLQGCNGMQADYLFQQDKQYDVSYDTGDKSIQCGRRNDIFKLWLSWRAKGDEGYGEQVDYLIDLANYLCQQLKKRPGYEMVMEKPDFVNVCFWYVPEKFRSMKPGPERDSAINEVAPKVKALMMESGTTMVGYQPLGNLPNFFRMIVSNPAATEADIDFLLDCIEKYSAEIFDDQPDEAGIGGGGGPAQ